MSSPDCLSCEYKKKKANGDMMVKILTNDKNNGRLELFLEIHH